jgi:hypothetical protein
MAYVPPHMRNRDPAGHGGAGTVAGREAAAHPHKRQRQPQRQQIAPAQQWCRQQRDAAHGRARKLVPTTPAGSSGGGGGGGWRAPRAALARYAAEVVVAAAVAELASLLSASTAAAAAASCGNHATASLFTGSGGGGGGCRATDGSLLVSLPAIELLRLDHLRSLSRALAELCVGAGMSARAAHDPHGPLQVRRARPVAPRPNACPFLFAR